MIQEMASGNHRVVTALMPLGKILPDVGSLCVLHEDYVSRKEMIQLEFPHNLSKFQDPSVHPSFHTPREKEQELVSQKRLILLRMRMSGTSNVEAN